MYSKKYGLELKYTAICFVNSSKRRRQSKRLHNINEVGSARHETTYKFLICADIRCTKTVIFLILCEIRARIYVLAGVLVGTKNDD